ncbi:MAG: V-type ATP synthase subunit I [Spirochaetaceae bacterium]|nr:MAG: V-type ATP synthase subunit I [Spirochaetaceae bacterium]
MIAKMKKISVITLKSQRDRTLENLRALGVVHVFTDRIEVESGEKLREQKNDLERCLSLLPPPSEARAADQSPVTGDGAVDAALALAEELLAKADRRSQLEDDRDRLQRELERIAPWGEMDPDLVRALHEKGVDVRLLEAPRDQEEEILARVPRSIVLRRTKALVRILAVAVGKEEAPAEELPQVALPEISTADLRAGITQRSEEIAGITAELEDHRGDIPLIREALAQLDQDLEFTRVASGMERDRLLQWVTGFVPHDEVERVQAAAREEGWGVVVRDPDPDEQVPTQLRNPAPIRIIRPVFDLLGTVPGYRELDISFFFLIFFTVFFAMIIGDGGYGLVLLGGTLFAALRGRAAGKAPGNGLILMIVLSSATVIWGAITGNWFGYAPFNQLPFLRSLVIPQIAIDNEMSTELIQYMCFIIGTVHLSIAHIWKFLRGMRERPRIRALEQLGWLSMVLGLYYLVLQLVIDADKYPMPDFAVPMIAGGLAGVILFSAQEEGRNFFIGIAMGFAGIITTILDSISAFSDIISYIRLFAVGLATLAIAEAFNSMAGGVAEGLGGAGGAIAAVLILFLGHTLNLAMGALSVVVHGVRLNMLEFSGHLGMEWTGVEYAPFKSRTQTTNQGEVAHEYR